MPVALSIIAPLFNEQDTVHELYTRLKQVVGELGLSCEFIFVDDGSSDHTLQVVEKLSAEDPAVKYVSFSRNFGHQAAMYAGIEKSTGEHVVLIDGDLQDPPEIILLLWKKMKEG